MLNTPEGGAAFRAPAPGGPNSVGMPYRRRQLPRRQMNSEQHSPLREHGSPSPRQPTQVPLTHLMFWQQSARERQVSPTSRQVRQVPLWQLRPLQHCALFEQEAPSRRHRPSLNWQTPKRQERFRPGQQSKVEPQLSNSRLHWACWQTLLRQRSGVQQSAVAVQESPEPPQAAPTRSAPVRPIAPATSPARAVRRELVRAKPRVRASNALRSMAILLRADDKGTTRGAGTGASDTRSVRAPPRSLALPTATCLISFDETLAPSRWSRCAAAPNGVGTGMKRGARRPLAGPPFHARRLPRPLPGWGSADD